LNIAFIPARGGSKGIPRKNIVKLGGRPLIYWTIDAAEDCRDIDGIVVSTDSDDIADAVARRRGQKTRIFRRGPESASDTASTEAAMLEFAASENFANIALIQATSPFVEAEDLSRGFALLRDGYDSVLSVARCKRFIWTESEYGASPQNYDVARRPRRQDFDGILVENGAFYITGRSRLLAMRSRVSGRIGLVKMDAASCLEIDEPDDLLVAEALIRRKHAPIRRDLSKIRMLLTDCDGTLTQGGMYYSDSGAELKRFHARDGLGFWMMKERGFLTGIVTGDDSGIPERRAAKLKMDAAYTNVGDKLPVIKKIAADFQLTLSQIAYIGDDLNDIDSIKAVGFSACPADAHPVIASAADYVSPLRGGCGAVRDVIELFLNEV
jgi:N-acylneuraminate cytidylyltransferase